MLCTCCVNGTTGLQVMNGLVPKAHPGVAAKPEHHHEFCLSRAAFRKNNEALETLRFTGGIIESGDGQYLPDNPDNSLSRMWDYDRYKWTFPGMPAVPHTPVAVAVITQGFNFMSIGTNPQGGYLCGRSHATTMYIMQLIHKLEITNIDTMISVLENLHEEQYLDNLAKKTNMTYDEKRLLTKHLLVLLNSAKSQPKVSFDSMHHFITM